MKIHPIHNNTDHEEALARIEKLWSAPEGSDDADERDVLIALVAAYEDQIMPILPPDPVDAIRFRLEQLGMKPADLQGIIGHRGRVSEVLNHKRSLSLGMIRALHKKLNIPLESLIQP